MPLPRILRTQTAALVPLFRRSIRPRSASPASRRGGVYDFLSRHLNSAAEAIEDVAPAVPEGPAPCLALVKVSARPRVSDAVELGVIHLPAPSPEFRRVALIGSTQYIVSHVVPARVAIKKAASEASPRPLRPVRVHSPKKEILLRRRFIPRNPETGEAECYYPRMRRLTVGTEAHPRITMIRRAPASLFARDVPLPVGWVSGGNAEGVLLEVRWRTNAGIFLERYIYINPRELEAEWAFWERKRANPAEYADRFSPLSGVLHCDITEEQAVKMYTGRLPEGSSVPLWNLPLEVRLVRAIANANQRMSTPVAMPREGRIYRRVIENIIRIVGTPLSEPQVTIEVQGSKMAILPRDMAIMKTLMQVQSMIFEFEKFVGIITYGLRNPSVLRKVAPIQIYRPVQTDPSEFPEFILTKALFTLERFEANTLLILSTPLDSPTVEFRTVSNAFHTSRFEAILKTIQSFSSAIGMGRAGVRHIIDRGMDESKYIIQGYDSLINRVKRNSTALLEAPLLTDFPITQMIYLGVSASGAATRVELVDRILEQSARALYMAEKLVRSVVGGQPSLRRIRSSMGIYPAERVIHMNQAREYSTMRRSSLNPERAIQTKISRANYSMRGAPTSPNRRPGGFSRVGSGFVKPKPKLNGRVRNEFLAIELEMERSMDGIIPNIAAQNPSPETVPDTNSADDTFGHNWESAGGGGGGGSDMSDFAEASGAKPLEIGDLCEVRSGSRAELGIFLRPTLGGEPTSDFLMVAGHVSRSQVPRITFAIPGFASREDAEECLRVYDRMLEIHGLPIGSEDLAAPRSHTAMVLDPLRAFIRRSSELYAERRPMFDGLYTQLAHETEETRITLFEATEMVFGVGCEQSSSYNAMLYAIHVALMGDGVRFMGDRGMHRATNVFRVRSKKDLGMIDSVTKWIRKINEEGRVSKNQFGAEGRKVMTKFIDKARYLIDVSREYRKEARRGLRKSPNLVERVDIGELKWDENDKFFIEYLKARVLKYGLQTTPIDGLAPVILRDTGRYGEVLDASTADEFLREIGAWSAWENTSLHQSGLSLPGLGRSKVGDNDEARLKLLRREGAVEKLGLHDSLSDIRKDWGDLEVFTIDDAAAHEIDDGISLERIPGSDSEFWIHAHIANPTAFIPEEHWITGIARRRVITHYLPEKRYAMLPSALTDQLLGVAPNRPVLTISTKVDTTGSILDYNICAGFVRTVIKATYDSLDKALGTDQKKTYVADISIGRFPENQQEHSRASIPRLSKEQLTDLKTLRELALAMRRRRVRDGLISTTTPQLNLVVNGGPGATNHPYNSPHPVLYRGYPAVHLTVEPPSEVDETGARFIVTEMMTLANNATAIWSAARRLPMPYRVMEFDHRRPDVLSVLRNKVLPKRSEFGQPKFEDAIRWLLLLGQTQLLAHPGPHRLLGLQSGYVKATSPLRRYSDMLAHYQIQRALLNLPPRPAAEMGGMLVDIGRGERAARYVSSEAYRLWTCVAIKPAWEAGFENFVFPKRLTLLVMEKNPFPSPSNGFVCELGTTGKVRFASKAQDATVAVGDIAHVEIEDVKLSERYVSFKFLELCRRASDNLGRF